MRGLRRTEKFKTDKPSNRNLKRKQRGATRLPPVAEAGRGASGSGRQDASPLRWTQHLPGTATGTSARSIRPGGRPGVSWIPSRDRRKTAELTIARYHRHGSGHDRLPACDFFITFRSWVTNFRDEWHNVQFYLKFQQKPIKIQDGIP